MPTAKKIMRSSIPRVLSKLKKGAVNKRLNYKRCLLQAIQDNRVRPLINLKITRLDKQHPNHKANNRSYRTKTQQIKKTPRSNQNIIKSR